MDIVYDEAKNQANIAKHGVSLAVAYEFDWGNALHIVDDRFAYGETRYMAVGYVGKRMHMMIYTRREDAFRIISLRKANTRERKKYGKE